MRPIPYPCRCVALRCAGLLIIAVALVSGCAHDAPVAGPAAVSTDAGVTAGDITDPAAALPPKVLASAPAAGARVEMEGEWLPDVSRVRLRIYVAGFPNLMGIAGHLRFDPAALQLATLAAQPVPVGPAKDLTTWEARTVARESPAGRVLLGGARFARKPSPYLALDGAAVDRELWVTAEFVVLKPGTHGVAFDPATIVARSDGNKDVAATWGSVQIAWKGGAQ